MRSKHTLWVIQRFHVKNEYLLKLMSTRSVVKVLLSFLLNSYGHLFKVFGAKQNKIFTKRRTLCQSKKMCYSAATKINI